MKIIYFLFIPMIILTISCSPKSRKLLKDEFTNNYKFDFEIQETFLRDLASPDYQGAATSFSAKGDYKNALIQWDNEPMFKPKIESYSKARVDSINNKFKVASAKDYIKEESKNNKLIIINESHHNAKHRVFTESLLEDLFNNGYRNLCLEALNKGFKEDSLLNRRKYPIQTTGYYIKNPQFGNLIRTALKIGYKLFPYETTQNIGGEVREKDQAENIAKIIKENPNEKFIVHCGSGHTLEGEIHFFGGAALAGRLNKLTGINPLTIDQVFYSEKSKKEYRTSIFKSFKIDKPSVLLDQKGDPFSYKRGNSWMDIVVFHPNTEYINNRPNWLIQNDKKLVQIEMDKIDLDFPIMVMAFAENENLKKAVPIDIYEVANKKSECFLVLDKGKYNIIVTNRSGDGLIILKKVN